MPPAHCGARLAVAPCAFRRTMRTARGQEAHFGAAHKWDKSSAAQNRETVGSEQNRARICLILVARHGWPFGGGRKSITNLNSISSSSSNSSTQRARSGPMGFCTFQPGVVLGQRCIAQPHRAQKPCSAIARNGGAQFSTVQHNRVQCSIVRYSTVRRSAVQYSTVQYSTLVGESS